MKFGKSWLWCPRGPLLSDGTWDLLRKELAKLAKKHGDVYVRIEPGVPANEEFIDGKVVKDCYMPTNTLQVDLEQSEEEILAQMTQKGRYNIKIADRYKVVIKETRDVNSFYEILKETARRDGFHIHEKEFYEDFLNILGEKARLYGAFIEDEMAGGLLATFFGKTATYYFGASAGKHRNAMAPYALQWRAIRDAKKEGFKNYDFLGVAPEGNEKHVLSGVTQFKTRFGGKRLDYKKPIVLVYRHFWYLLVKLAKKF
jgi:lipid II:glycine glycyltransferase (peptidoglycan interpeptide bridge formation enzyme)